MRNTGDLDVCTDMDPNFITDGLRLSLEIGLPTCSDLFGRTVLDFQRDYFDLFDDVCNELRETHA